MSAIIHHKKYPTQSIQHKELNLILNKANNISKISVTKIHRLLQQHLINKLFFTIQNSDRTNCHRRIYVVFFTLNNNKQERRKKVDSSYL